MSKKDTAYTTKLKHATPLNLMFGVTESEPTTSEATDIKTIDRQRIKLDPTQPRRYFDPKKQEKLAQSIKAVGILQPLLVRPLPNGDYELVAGERRLKAADMAVINDIPVIIREMDETTIKEIRLVENLQREDLNAYEETIAILELLALRLKMNQEEVISLLNRIEKSKRKKADNVIRHDNDEKADNVIRPEDTKIVEDVFSSLGRLSPESFRTNRLPLLNLPDEIKQALSQGQIEYTKARAIAKLKIEDERIQLLEEAIEQDLPLSEIQKRVQNIINNVKDSHKDTSLKSQYKEISKQLSISKVWDNPKKRKNLEKLINQIKLLLDEEEITSEI